MALPEPRHIPGPYHDHYPYESQGFDEKWYADNARAQDNRITDLQYQNRLLSEELYRLHTWRNQLLPILEANGIDLDETISIMAATKEVFSE